MKKTLNWLLALVLAASSLALAGCGTQGDQTPTVDPVIIYTQVAQTVQAQVTNNAKLTPKATNTAQPTETTSATATLRPSSTPFGTQAPTSLTPAKTTTPGSNLTPAKTGTNAALPTFPAATVPGGATQPPVSSPDKMLYISQVVPDGATYGQNEGFTQKWVIKNIGTTTWDSTYLIRLYAGERFNGTDGPLDQTVKPNGQATISIDMRAPNTRGEYTSFWVITNPDGRNFGSFTLTIKVR